MKKNLRSLGVAMAGFVALALSSCAYDPYYSSTSIGYSSGGFGPGYGYGGSSFNTSLFVSTGDPRWGYDPYCYSYYDYRSRRYYDPYLNGFYPIGYRPPIVYGVPHPYGWRPGNGFCPPPRRVTNVTVVNYTDRAGAYRHTNYDWARQVRPMDSRQSFNSGNSFSRPQWGGGNSQGGRPQFDRDSNQGGRPQFDRNPNQGGRPQFDRNPGQNGNWGSRPANQSSGRPSRYNNPVSISDSPRENFNSRPQLGIPAERSEGRENSIRGNRSPGGSSEFNRPGRGGDNSPRGMAPPAMREQVAPAYTPAPSPSGGGYSPGGGYAPGGGSPGRGGDSPGRSGGFRGEGEGRGRDR